MALIPFASRTVDVRGQLESSAVKFDCFLESGRDCFLFWQAMRDNGKVGKLEVLEAVERSFICLEN